MKHLNYYETEEVTICSYCGDIKGCDSHGCCGESSCHFETAIEHDGEVYQYDEVTLYRPILDVIRFEILNKWVWLDRKRRFKMKLNNFFKKSYDGTYPNESFIRKVRRLTGFQWTKLDCFILEQIYGHGLVWTKSEKQWAAIRKESVKMIRKMWAENNGVKSVNLVPPIRDDE